MAKDKPAAKGAAGPATAVVAPPPRLLVKFNKEIVATSARSSGGRTA